MAGAVPQDRLGRRNYGRAVSAADVRAALVYLTAGLLPTGYVLAAGIPLLLAWVWENASARRWPWEPSPVDRPLLLWVAVVAVSSALSAHRDLALANTALLALGPVAALAPSLRTLRERPQALGTVCAAWTAGGALAGAWVVWRYLHTGAGRGDLPELGWNAAGTVLAAASLVALGLALTTKSRTRVLLWAAQLPVLAGLLATLSRGAWVGWLAGVLCFCLLAGTASRRVRWGAVAVLVGVLLAASSIPAFRARALTLLDPGHYRYRIVVWKAAMRMVADRPWTGVGFGAFVREYDNYRVPEDSYAPAPFAHNLPLSLAAETGLPGLAAFLVFLGALLRAGYRTAARSPDPDGMANAGAAAALAAVLVQQLVDGTLQSFHLGFAFWILAAALLSPRFSPSGAPP
ncbi:MAG: O-antigen ligase family protein [Armatimonadota bacterium]|nr:O-antigen ligase family protein [Armatimonadota bacterium]